MLLNGSGRFAEPKSLFFAMFLTNLDVLER